MSYLDSGFNRFFSRDIAPLESDGDTSVYDFDSKFDGLSADKLTGGIFRSQNGDIEFDLVEGRFIVKSNGTERLRLGNLSDGGAGMVILDLNGKEIFRISDDKNFIKSPDGATEVDFDGNRITVREGDDTGPIRVLLGYDPKGF